MEAPVSIQKQPLSVLVQLDTQENFVKQVWLKFYILKVVQLPKWLKANFF